MNLELMNDHIRYFTREIIESGFKRDIDDYITSLPDHQNNIITLREIATKVFNILDHVYHSDLPNALQALLPSDDHMPFTKTPHYENLKDTIENVQIELPEFYSQLNNCLTELKTQLENDQSGLNKIKKFIAPYVAADVEHITQEDIATISIVFKEQQTISSLEQFTKTIVAWNRSLPIYHQLLKSESPEDIQIVQVQNGSIDFIVNIDVDVALNLVDLFKLGFEVFCAYLSYKQMIKPIIDSYHGHKELISQEEEREKLLLENIGAAIDKEIKNQHRKAKKADKNIDGTAITKKIEQVSHLFTSHIVKGNDIKLLALPESVETEDVEDDLLDIRESLREQSLAARRMLSHIPPDAQKKLLEAYGKIDEEA